MCLARKGETGREKGKVERKKKFNGSLGRVRGRERRGGKAFGSEWK